MTIKNFVDNFAVKFYAAALILCVSAFAGIVFSEYVKLYVGIEYASAAFYVFTAVLSCVLVFFNRVLLFHRIDFDEVVFRHIDDNERDRTSPSMPIIADGGGCAGGGC